jgi:parallel beta-helix repeat protein
MKKSQLFWALCLALTTFFSSCSEENSFTGAEGSRLKASYAEVTKSGSTYTGKVDGVVKYTGTDFFACCNTCINAMSSGTIKLKNSGSSGPSGGALKYINLKSNITFDGGGCQIDANTTDHLIVPIMADRKSNIKIQNLKIVGAPRYAVWLKGCSNITISGLTMNMTNGWLGLRIDNSTGATSSANVGNINVSGGSMGVETYGLNGFTMGTATANNMTECGVLLNASTNCTISTVNATRCNYGGGYAGFRCANNNGKTTVGTVTSTSCGRGFFSLTGSRDCTINTVNAYSCSGIGIWIQDSPNTIVKSGTVRGNGGGCWSITGNSPGSKVTVSCQ